jgi:Zn-dependent protease/CBS domain-containing protein
MTETLRLGRLFGVDVGINWSVFVIFALITFGLAAGRFPLIYPDHGTAAYAAAGLVAGVIFLASLLAHEIAHAVVAQRNGVGVDGITLWLFGGVARLTGEPDTPGADFRIAGVGPLVSAALAGAFAVIATALDGLGVHELVSAVAVWLAVINVVLAVFNLVPAAPLDGGRILRAAAWRITGDRYRSAVIASRAGRGFGWALVALGFLVFVGGAGLSGLWLVLIGWFISNSAAAEQQHAELTRSLHGVRVRDVMTPEPAVVDADLSVQEFLDRHVFTHRHSTFPVVDVFGEPVGLVTLGRVKRVPVNERARTRLASVACPLHDVAVAAPGEPLSELLPRMSACSEGRALVVEHGHLRGIVSPSDIVRQLEISELREARGLSHSSRS